MRNKNILFLAIAVLVVLLDQATKAWIVSSLRLHESIAVIGGFFNITYVRNPGAAFGFLATAPPLFRHTFFIIVTAVAILLILHYIRTGRVGSLSMASALGLILAGAVGNLIDRIRFGEVVDFLDVYIANYHWPAFNVADSSITVGAAILIVALLSKPKEATQGC